MNFSVESKHTFFVNLSHLLVLIFFYHIDYNNMYKYCMFIKPVPKFIRLPNYTITRI
jgi:hypothetical protein